MEKKLWDFTKPFVIAEMSGNHNHSLQRALDLVEAAAKAGVDALKIQTYTADTMTLNLKQKDFVINDDKNLWNGQDLYGLYLQAYTPWEWHKEIFEKCNELGIIGFSTPFDASAVDFLEELGVPFYKIASFENVDIPLIKKIAATGKPIIMSTGMATIAELDEAVRAARQCGCRNITLLKCTSTYPANPVDSNIITIPHLKELFQCNVGISDHTLGIGVAVASVALGGTVVEKHFTLSRADGGVDAVFSLEPNEMRQLVEEVQSAWQSLGTINYGPTVAEQQSIKYRRSLYIAADIKQGEVFTSENLRSIRPGLGLAPKYYETILGRKAKMDIKKGTPLSWELLL